MGTSATSSRREQPEGDDANHDDRDVDQPPERDGISEEDHSQGHDADRADAREYGVGGAYGQCLQGVRQEVDRS